MGSNLVKEQCMETIKKIFQNKHELRQKVMNKFTTDELCLIYLIFDGLVKRSKNQLGIDRCVFVNYCPLPGLWYHRIFNMMLKENLISRSQVMFKGFLIGLMNLCRSDIDELDKNIFDLFNLSENHGFIQLEDMRMMLLNLPDLGF